MARYKMWSFKVAVAVLGLAMAEQSMQLSVRHPLHGVIRKINEEGPYLGLVLVSDTNEQALQASNVFVPSNYAATVALGRTFHVGKINGTNVVYVKTGDASVNAAATVQLLIDVFPIKFKSKKGQLRFGDYNNPAGGDNLLGSIDFQPTSLYTPEQKQTIFGFPSTQAAYREYIYTKFKASTVDEESAAVALVALSNEVPFIVFRGVPTPLVDQPHTKAIAIWALSML
ncbi:hypothetical protein GH714_020500 [Hevea brasiliensis]|uniref:Nucleoside phosphorylase domain-containing protein n=1 Tax=Hevea brasiliensis TaxID=3981 RepID=A0A6A6LYZ9_HEVBR|nr:hypothetical protein GH714_020500 [Hevea brasiliensis]